jgi:hypothetical protein
MTIDSNYTQHVEVTKKLQMAESFNEVRKPFAEGFEEIYTQAKEEKVTISNAKEFLNSLSEDEMNTLQNFTRLADEINVETLNDEGAYNLLLHHYEKYDFDGDGIVSDGIGKTNTLLPTHMPTKEKEALVETLNSMNEKDRFLSLMMVNPPQFVRYDDGSISTKINTDTVDYNTIIERVNRILNPMPGEYRSDELMKSIENFKKLFEENYNEKSRKQEQYKLQIENEVMMIKASISQKIEN